VNVLPYKDLNDLIQLCIKVEQQILRKGSSCKESSYSSSYPNKDYKKEREDNFLKDKSKLETPKSVGKDVSTPQTRTRDIQCFKCLGRGHITSQCPNMRTMILRGKDEYSSEKGESSEGEEKEKSEREYPCEGELLMIRRTLNN